MLKIKNIHSSSEMHGNKNKLESNYDNNLTH